MGPPKQSLVETISLQRCNCNIFGLQPLWPYSLNTPDFTDFGCSSGQVLSKTKSLTPHFFYISDITNSSLSMVKFPGKSMLEKFGANVLNHLAWIQPKKRMFPDVVLSMLPFEFTRVCFGSTDCCTKHFRHKNVKWAVFLK